jgi:hypothetical protein
LGKTNFAQKAYPVNVSKIGSQNKEQGSGHFFYDKMPGCCLPSRIAATTLQFTAGCLQPALEQEPTPCFAFLVGNSPLPIKSTGAIILS